MLIQPRSEEDHKNIVEQGFTLVELLIVIVILGILAGIVVFAVGNLTQNATKDACKTEADTFTTAFQAYRVTATPAAFATFIDPVATPTVQAQANILKGLPVPLLTFSTTQMKYLVTTEGGQAAATASRWTANKTTGIADVANCT